MPQDLAALVAEKLKKRMDRESKPIIVNISNRHWHCTQETFEKLFGAGAKPTNIRDLIQPGQYACKETVTLKGPKGEIKNARLIGPFRAYNQIELSRTDCVALGIDAPVRDSGNVKGSAPITLIGPMGEVKLERALSSRCATSIFRRKKRSSTGSRTWSSPKSAWANRPGTACFPFSAGCART